MFGPPAPVPPALRNGPDQFDGRQNSRGFFLRGNFWSPRGGGLTTYVDDARAAADQVENGARQVDRSVFSAIGK